MNFAESASRLAGQLSERRSMVATEEAVKQSLILPFIQLLGFDIYDPREVIPEYKAGWAKVNEKIDYGLAINGVMALFIEAKGPHEVLVNYDPQLAKYFNSTPEVKFAIITNGIQYRFFTDLQEPNILDKKPFLEFDAEKVTDAEISILEKFQKETFNVKALVAYAEDLIYLSTLKHTFRSLLLEPSPELVKLAIKSTSLVDGLVTQKVVDRFRPLVKESISSAILDIVGESFQAGQLKEAPEIAAVPDPTPAAPLIDEPKKDAREITAIELELYGRFISIVQPDLPEPDVICYGTSTAYLTIQYGRAAFNRNWILRLYTRVFRGKFAIVVRIPVERVNELAPGFEVDEAPQMPGGSRLYFHSVDDLDRLKPLLVEAAKLAAGLIAPHPLPAGETAAS